MHHSQLEIYRKEQNFLKYYRIHNHDLKMCRKNGIFMDVKRLTIT